ncbi:Mhp366/Mhp367 family surface (lipo)protein [Mycoplasma sp. 'Moose RK']|uniref:Mhp366/Mhp367 family surface (lipo)protein n=1 Tax=Mycoplasma sp. 'Moose RK' TaxID=2780095 RepID=UPI0018C24D77|nr:hypothetical protein [Mycoplasma sp. 'Moose RK']MBG0730695.1 hypothetical protein [Mycoplasma sp. 'Moose RK']
MTKKIKKFFFLIGLIPFLSLSCTTKINLDSKTTIEKDKKTEKKVENSNADLPKPEKSESSIIKPNQEKAPDSKKDSQSEENKKEIKQPNQEKAPDSKKDSQSEENNLDYNTKSNSVSETKTEFDFVKVNHRSLFNFKPELLSDAEKPVIKKPFFSKGIEQFFLNNSQKAIKKENDSMFLGQENNKLKVYLLDKMRPNLVDSIQAKANYFSYFNPQSLSRYYNLRWFGYDSLPIEDKKFFEIYTRNMRFSSGSAVFLNANSQKAAFLTNRHVIFPGRSSNLPFWELMNKKTNGNFYPSLRYFLRYYDDYKIKELDNRPLLQAWLIKERIEKSKKNNQLNANFLNSASENAFATNLYKNYFELANFDNENLDVAVFYFSYAKFIKDVDSLIEFYQKNKTTFFTQSSEKYLLSSFDNFISSFADFKKYWEKIHKFPPLKISDRTWGDGDFDFTTKIGLFWPNDINVKNIFKGINFRQDIENPRMIAANFFATNGPGASGSGIYNTDGSLAFINRSILTVNGDVSRLFYDQYGLTSHLTSGLALKTDRYNLVEKIQKLYLK